MTDSSPAMTENTPDAVMVAREAIAKRYDSLTAKEVRAGGFDGKPEMRDAILGARAMQAAMPAPAGVRKLEWAEEVQGTWWIADAYRIEVFDGGGFAARVSQPQSRAFRTIAHGISFDEAKAAAQTDYERRVLSALEPAVAQEGAKADTRLNAVTGGIDQPAALATKQPADSRPDPALGTAREAPDMTGDKVGVSTLAPTPAGAGDLVERVKAMASYNGFDIPTLVETASRIEALEAEVARLTERRKAANARSMRLWAQMKEALTLMDAAEARATTAEADLAALRAEVERALAEVAYKPGDHPIIPVRIRRSIDRLSAALAPAKAGG